MHKCAEYWSQFWGAKTRLSYSSPQVSTEEWWSQIVSGGWQSIDTNSLHVTCSPDWRKKTLSSNVHKWPLPSAFLGGRPWFTLEENVSSAEGANIALKEPSSVQVQTSSFQGKAFPDLPALDFLVQAAGGLLELRSSEASWQDIGLPGRASVFLSFLVMQSLVRKGNKTLIFWRGINHLQGIIFYEQKTLKCCWFILIADTMSKCPSCLFVLLASMDEKWNGADPIRAG